MSTGSKKDGSTLQIRKRLFGSQLTEEGEDQEEFGSPSFGVKARRQEASDKHNFRRDDSWRTQDKSAQELTFDERFRLEV